MYQYLGNGTSDLTFPYNAKLGRFSAVIWDFPRLNQNNLSFKSFFRNIFKAYWEKKGVMENLTIARDASTVFLRILAAIKSLLIDRTIGVPPRIGRIFRPISERAQKVKIKKNSKFKKK